MTHRMRKSLIGGCLGILFAGAAARAQQSEPTQREIELERMVRELNDRLMRMEDRLNELESGRPGTTMPADEGIDERIGNLEKSVEEIQQSSPPAEGSEDWEKMRRAVDLFSESNTMRPYWKDGLRFETADGSFKLKIGGRIHLDWNFFVNDNDIERSLGEELEDGVEFRRARMYLSGDIYDNIEFKAEYDFAEGDADFTDVYVGIKSIPVVGNLRVGHMREPFGLEELTSSNHLTFMERSLVTAFSPARNTGFLLHDAVLDERMTWAVGFFRETDNFGDGVGGRNYNATTRLTGLPWYNDDGAKLLHLGVSYTHQNYEDDTVRFRARPEDNQAPAIIDTGVIRAEYGDIVVAEAALVLGPFSLQGEFAEAFVESRIMSDPTFWGTYAQASYVLTGEHRRYKKGSGAFEGIIPRRNFGKDGGWGAWEIAARYSHLTLNDGWVRGGLLRDMTLGLNWFLNPNMRMMFNYVLADAEDRGDVHAFEMRFQLHY